MLKLFIKQEEFWDERNGKFITYPDTKLELEHSLASLSKWESKHQKPFLVITEKTDTEWLDYIEAMIITPNYDPNDVSRLKDSDFEEIYKYVDSKQSATTFGKLPEHKGPSEIITSELIYYWMVAFNIPFECENWHLNRLFALIRVCNIKNQKPKKRSLKEMAEERTAINNARREKLGTRG